MSGIVRRVAINKFKKLIGSLDKDKLSFTEPAAQK